MPIETKGTEIALYIQTLLRDDATLGLKGVIYGSSDRVPDTPYAFVEPADKLRDREGMMNQMRLDIAVNIILFISSLQQPHDTWLEADQLAEKAEAVLHADLTLGGRVIDGYVEYLEHGYVQRPNQVLMRAVRLRWVGRSRERL